MRAVLLTRFGGLDALRATTDAPRPTPGPGEVVVAVAAASVNNTDVWTREGAYGSPADPAAPAGWRGVPLSFPRIQGGDAVGRVVEVGPDVSEDRLGRRVLVDCALYAGEEGGGGADPDAVPVGLLGSERDGGFAERVVVADARAHDVTDSPLDDHELACLPIAYGTALGMLRRADARPGDLVLVTGASGGVGLAVVQLASALGAHVVAVTSQSKAAAVRAAGAHETVAREGGAVPAADAVLAGRAVDVVADVVAGDDLGQWVTRLAFGGRVVVAGALAGAAVTLDVRRLYLENRRLVGSTMHTPRIFAELVGLAVAGVVRPVVAARRPLEELADAQRELLARRHVGKIVIAVDGR